MVISRVAVAITYMRGLITPLITTHEPPSKARRVLVVLERRVFIPVLRRIWKVDSLNEFDGELLSRPWTHSGVKSF